MLPMKSLIAATALVASVTVADACSYSKQDTAQSKEDTVATATQQPTERQAAATAAPTTPAPAGTEVASAPAPTAAKPN